MMMLTNTMLALTTFTTIITGVSAVSYPAGEAAGRYHIYYKEYNDKSCPNPGSPGGPDYVTLFEPDWLGSHKNTRPNDAFGKSPEDVDYTSTSRLMNTFLYTGKAADNLGDDLSLKVTEKPTDANGMDGIMGDCESYKNKDGYIVSRRIVPAAIAAKFTQYYTVGNQGIVDSPDAVFENVVYSDTNLCDSGFVIQYFSTLRHSANIFDYTEYDNPYCSFIYSVFGSDGLAMKSITGIDDKVYIEVYNHFVGIDNNNYEDKMDTLYTQRDRWEDRSCYYPNEVTSGEDQWGQKQINGTNDTISIGFLNHCEKKPNGWGQEYGAMWCHALNYWYQHKIPVAGTTKAEVDISANADFQALSLTVGVTETDLLAKCKSLCESYDFGDGVGGSNNNCLAFFVYYKRNENSQIVPSESQCKIYPKLANRDTDTGLYFKDWQWKDADLASYAERVHMCSSEYSKFNFRTNYGKIHCDKLPVDEAQDPRILEFAQTSTDPAITSVTDETEICVEFYDNDPTCSNDDMRLLSTHSLNPMTEDLFPGIEYEKPDLALSNGKRTFKLNSCYTFSDKGPKTYSRDVMKLKKLGGTCSDSKTIAVEWELEPRTSYEFKKDTNELLECYTSKSSTYSDEGSKLTHSPFHLHDYVLNNADGCYPFAKFIKPADDVSSISLNEFYNFVDDYEERGLQIQQKGATYMKYSCGPCTGIGTTTTTTSTTTGPTSGSSTTTTPGELGAGVTVASTTLGLINTFRVSIENVNSNAVDGITGIFFSDSSISNNPMVLEFKQAALAAGNNMDRYAQSVRFVDGQLLIVVSRSRKLSSESSSDTDTVLTSSSSSRQVSGSGSKTNKVNSKVEGRDTELTTSSRSLQASTTKVDILFEYQQEYTYKNNYERNYAINFIFGYTQPDTTAGSRAVSDDFENVFKQEFYALHRADSNSEFSKLGAQSDLTITASSAGVDTSSLEDYSTPPPYDEGDSSGGVAVIVVILIIIGSVIVCIVGGIVACVCCVIKRDNNSSGDNNRKGIQMAKNTNSAQNEENEYENDNNNGEDLAYQMDSVGVNMDGSEDTANVGVKKGKKTR